MAFLGQISAKFSELKEVTKNQFPQVVEQANKAKHNLTPMFNKCSKISEQLDSLAKIDIGKLIKVNVEGRKQSPIDILPSITAFDSVLENATFQLSYDETCQLVVHNVGSCITITYPAGESSDTSVSFLPDNEYHLEQLNLHWGTEPMNGSEHTVGGVGYAGELHFLHRNIKYPTLEQAFKQPNGVVAFAVFLNESHDDNLNLVALTKVLPNVAYNGNESGLAYFRATQLVPSNDKSRDFWVYDGSETIPPYRELVTWIVFRSAMPISSAQLEQLRQLRKSKTEDEVEEKMSPIRPLQVINSRLIRSSFKGSAGVELS